MTSPVEQVTETGRPAGLVQYFAAALLARTADEGARVALLILALDRTGSAAIGGTLVATLLVPHVVAAPVVGMLVDRSRRPAVVLGAAFAGLAGGLAATVALLGHAPLWPAYVVLALAGCCGPAVSGGLTSRLASLAGSGHEARAFGLDSLLYNVAGVAGPAAVGLIAVAAGAGAATLTLAVAAGLGAVCVATLHLPASTAAAEIDPTAPEMASTAPGMASTAPGMAPTAAAGGAPSVGLFAGAAAIGRDPALRALTLTTGFSQLGAGGLAVVATTLAAAAHVPARSGLLLSVVALGGFVGSLLWVWRPQPAARAPMVTAWTMVGTGLPLALAAGVHSLALTAALFGLSGIFTGPFAAAMFLARDHLAAEAIRTQVFTIGAGLKTAAAALGAGLLGFAAHLPAAAQLLLVAAPPIIAGLAAHLLFSRRSAASF